MDLPPPSQSQAPKSTLFSNTDGTPIRVFTQADLQGRNRVLKDLRINGAELCSDATNAQIMLVDTQTRQGVQFIREWGQDANKTVLSYAWVKKSLTAGRPLFKEDQWGECLTHVDGAPIDGQGDAMNEDIAKSPLPTPRVTPDELAKLRSKIVNTRQPSVSTNSPAEDLAPAAPSPPHTTTLNGLPFSTDVMSSQPLTAPMPPMPGMNPFMFNTMPNMPNLPSPMMAFTAQAMQAMMANMLMNANTMPNQPSFSNDGFLLALQDSMRNHGVSSWQGPQVQTGVPPDGRLNQPISPMREPPLPYPKALPSSKEEYTPSPPMEPSGSRHVSSSCDFVGNSFEKGKDKERSCSLPHKRRKISSSSATTVGKHSVGPSTNGPSSQQKLFTKNGRPLRFFVQIEIHHRFNLVSSIKKNGGMIVDSPNTADYAVLYSGNQTQRYNVFKKLLSAAQSAGVPAVQAKFVNECVAENELLESGPFLYLPESTGKRKRSKSAISVELESEDKEDPIEKRRIAKNARQAERRAMIKMEKEKEEEEMRMKPRSSTGSWARSTPRTKFTEKDSYPKATDGPRTPSPPQNSRERCPTGYRFSQAENEFALQYAKILIDRDHTVSQSVAVSAIHEKLPHHSLKSWRSHFTNIASEWDTWRKRAAIAYRKGQSMKEAEYDAGVPSMEVGTEEISIAGPSPAVEEEQNFLNDLEDDLNSVVRFFVEGNDQDHSEDEHLVWKRLAAMMPCKTENSWEEFYDKNSREVITRYNKALEAAK